jgi:serine/tyrosine/threonine adenylyltransferase
MFARLGIRPTEPERDSAFLLAIETALAARTVEIDRFFFDWRGGRRRAPSPADEAYGGEPFAAFRDAIGGYEPVEAASAHPYWADQAPCSMPIGEVEAIWSRIDEADDWSPFDEKIKAVRRMGQAMRPPA